jgi:ATP-dependent helicase Lhr and Lhr-like helicase
VGGRPPEYVEPKALAEIHRRTLVLLRREVRPVALSTYADFVARWQHLHPDERLSGAGGLRRVLQQLRAAAVVGVAWERDVLPLRLVDYRPEELEELVRQGQLLWVASGGSDPRRARVRLLFRGEGGVFLEAEPEGSELGDSAKVLWDFLRQEGALFLADIRDGLRLSESEARRALAELALAGLVTSDSLAALRDLLGATPVLGRRPGRERSPLEEELARRLAGRPTRVPPRRAPGRAAYRAASRRARRRLRDDHEMSAGIRAGRWSLVHRFGVLGRSLTDEERARRQARQLLLRHGVVTRLSLEREEGGWEWTGIFEELQRMEMRGEVRRGYFVAGLPGTQFALPEAVERLRGLGDRAGRERARPALVVMNATDPAASLGGAANGPRSGAALTYARLPSTWLVQQRGLALLVAEDSGARLRTRPGAAEEELRLGLSALVDHLSRFIRVLTVMTWDGQPVLETEGALLLAGLGFYPDHPGMSFERSTARAAVPPGREGGVDRGPSGGARAPRPPLEEV